MGQVLYEQNFSGLLNTNIEIMGKLENGKMIGQFKILVITKCCANYFLQYNNNRLEEIV